jgi:hypothetical protein
MSNEPIPVSELLTDIDGQWNASNVTKPVFIVVNASETEPLRFDLNRGDYLIGRTGSPAMEEEPIGNWKYGNRAYVVEIELYTLANRQRLYDLMKEVRRITHNRKHSLTNYQRQQFMGFSEEVSEQVNVWTGSLEIELVNNGVLLDT